MAQVSNSNYQAMKAQIDNNPHQTRYYSPKSQKSDFETPGNTPGKPQS